MASGYRVAFIGLSLILLLTLLLGLVPLPAPTFTLSFYLPLHTAMEVLAVGIALMMLAAGWAESNRQGARLRTIILISAFWGAALLDLSHLLSFPGMPDYFGPNSLEQTIHFWLAARLLLALALLLIVLPQSEAEQSRDRLWWALAGVTSVVVALHVWFLRFPETVPTMFAPGSGLTPAKLGLEYLTALLNLAAIGILIMQRNAQFSYHGPALAVGLGTMAISSVYFTLYSDYNDLFNLLGHVLKLVSYGFLLRALYFESVTEPYRALEQTQSRLEATLQALPDWMFEIDIEGIIHDFRGMNDEGLIMPPEQFIGRQLADIVPAQVVKATMDAMGNALINDGRSESYEYSLARNAEVRWYETVAALKKPADPVVPRFIILTRDITERKRSLAGDQLNAIAFHTREAIMITDAERRIVRVNPAFTEITGYTEEEVVGRNPRFLSSGRHDEAFYRRLWESIEKTGSWQGEIWNQHKNGRVYAEHVVISSVANRTGDITHYVASFTDITEHKEAQERIVQLAYYDPLTHLANRRLLIEQLYERKRLEADMAMGLVENQFTLFYQQRTDADERVVGFEALRKRAHTSKYPTTWAVMCSRVSSGVTPQPWPAIAEKLAASEPSGTVA